MKQRNTQWLEMINSIKDLIKENDDVKVTVKPDGTTEYLVTEDFNWYFKKFTVILTEEPIENGTEYELYVSWINDKDAARRGKVIVKNENGKIRYSRKEWFKQDENNKPLSSLKIGLKACYAMLKVNEYNQLYKMVDGDSEKIKSIRAYIKNFVSHFHSRKFFQDQLEEIIDKGTTLEYINNDDLFDIIAQKYFGCNNEKLLGLLKENINYIGLFLEDCYKNGLFERDFVEEDTRVYFKVPDELKKELWIKIA